MWSASNLDCDAFLLVYDITSAQSLKQLDFFAELIEMERENRQEQGRCWPAIMVVGNKCDLAGNRQVGAQEGLEWAKSRGCGFMETSAREVVNIEETFAGELPFFTHFERESNTDGRNSNRQACRRSQETICPRSPPRVSISRQPGATTTTESS